MTVKIGILGIGGMGVFHFKAYQNIKGVKVAAICDDDPKKLSGDWSSIEINIGSRGTKPDLTGIRTYSQAEEMIADPEIDVVDVTLPTYLHARFTLKAFEAGKHVICEKPMALDSCEAQTMLEAARKAQKRLFIAHCLRFWPEYVKAREIIKTGEYGKVVSAGFRRLSRMPGYWSRDNWFEDPAKSGSCALDLHIHDSDFILYAFGSPKAVTSHAVGLAQGRIDHIVTVYDYGADRLVSAEGAWEYAPGFGFEMSFIIAMEKATLVLEKAGDLMLHPFEGDSQKLSVPEGDGYELELKHFVQCITGNKASDVVPPESALASVKLVESELKSALTGKTVPVTF